MDAEKLDCFLQSAMRMLKYRKDRMQDDYSRDEYYEQRIREAISTVEGRGIILRDTTEDLMLVVDIASEYDANRDKQTGEPAWLRQKLMRRWMAQ